jgi:S1-C subfamily serine protease
MIRSSALTTTPSPRLAPRDLRAVLTTVVTTLVLAVVLLLQLVTSSAAPSVTRGGTGFTSGAAAPTSGADTSTPSTSSEGGPSIVTLTPSSDHSLSPSPTTQLRLAHRFARTVVPGLVNIDVAGTEDKAGTGVVLSADGLVITNDHVISGASTIVATDLGNHHRYRAELIGADPVHDIAVLALLDAHHLTVARIGDSDSARVGTVVASIGNAEGQGVPTIGVGRITGLHRRIASTTDTSTDAAQLRGLIATHTGIEPGQSGGALVNSASQVIALNVAYSRDSATAGPNGYGYAIPINTALHVAHQLLNNAYSTPDDRGSCDSDYGCWDAASSASNSALAQSGLAQ